MIQFTDTEERQVVLVTLSRGISKIFEKNSNPFSYDIESIKANKIYTNIAARIDVRRWVGVKIVST